MIENRDMKIKLAAEISVMCLAVIVFETWEGWLKWPEGGLMSAALAVVACIVILRNTAKPPKA